MIILKGTKPHNDLIVLNMQYYFLHSAKPLNNIAPSQRLFLWCICVKNMEHRLSLSSTESPSGSSDAWSFWSCLNHPQTAIGCCRANLQKWVYATDVDHNCQCSQSQTMEPLLVCPNLEDPCTLDLETLTSQAKLCVQHWIGVVQ